MKRPLLADARTRPLWESATLCLLVAMSLLAFLGLRDPVKLLPVPLFESVCKLLWLGLVACPTSFLAVRIRPRARSLSTSRWSS